METLIEQRKERRTKLSWPVSVWLPEADRFFNGRRANISKTGVLITVPISTPCPRGQHSGAELPGGRMYSPRKRAICPHQEGRVVRVDRRSTLNNASIALGIVFE